GSDRRLGRTSPPRPARTRTAKPPRCQTYLTALHPPGACPPLSIERTRHALETAIALVNVAPVAVGLHVLFDQAPDAIFDCMETRSAFNRQPARAFDGYWDRLFDLSRPAGKDHDTVR